MSRDSHFCINFSNLIKLGTIVHAFFSQKKKKKKVNYFHTKISFRFPSAHYEKYFRKKIFFIFGGLGGIFFFLKIFRHTLRTSVLTSNKKPLRYTTCSFFRFVKTSWASERSFRIRWKLWFSCS